MAVDVDGVDAGDDLLAQWCLDLDADLHTTEPDGGPITFVVDAVGRIG